MLNEEILAERPRVLTQAQRTFYFRHGYLLLERFIEPAWLDRLHDVAESFIEASRSASPEDGAFDLAPGHTPEQLRLRRVNTPDQRHDLYWEFATGVVADVAADLVGSNVAFHHSKLNFKWNDGADGVTWHQDIPFYPHSNYSPLTIGLYLADAGDGARPGRRDRREPRGAALRPLRCGRPLGGVPVRRPMWRRWTWQRPGI